MLINVCLFKMFLPLVKTMHLTLIRKTFSFNQERHLKVDHTHLTDNRKLFNIQSKNIKRLIKITLTSINNNLRLLKKWVQSKNK